MQTLDVFLKEAGLPSEAATADRYDLTIEKVLEEKKTFDVSVQFERLGRDDEAKGWSIKGGFFEPFLPFIDSLIWTMQSLSRALYSSDRCEHRSDSPVSFKHPSCIYIFISIGRTQVSKVQTHMIRGDYTCRNQNFALVVLDYSRGSSVRRCQIYLTFDM